MAASVVVGGLLVLLVAQLVVLRSAQGPVAVRAERPAVARVPVDLGSPEVQRRLVLAAVIAGALLRLVWVVIATRTPTELRDPAEYLRIASDFGHGILPRFGGLDHSAYWPPGFPAVLAPAVAVADRTGWLSPAFAAALVNVVGSTVTIYLTSVLAGQWLGPRTRATAAWLVALSPALVYWTATAHAESVFTPIFLGVIVLSSAAAAEPSRRRWAVVGIVLGLAFLVRSPAVVVAVAPALAIVARGGTWGTALRANALVGVAALVVLVPWAVRNGVQVGIWSPASTNNAAAACQGHHEGTEADYEQTLQHPEVLADCLRRSPFDDDRFLGNFYGPEDVPPGMDLDRPDEPRWYREAMGSAISFAVHHPVEEARLSGQKLWQIWSDEGRVVDGARNYAEPGWAGRWNHVLGALANLWLWIVGGLAIVALAFVPAARRALPIWVPIVGYTLAIVGGVAEPHYRYPVLPLVAVLAAGALARRSSVVGP